MAQNIPITALKRLGDTDLLAVATYDLEPVQAPTRMEAFHGTASVVSQRLPHGAKEQESIPISVVVSEICNVLVRSDPFKNIRWELQRQDVLRAPSELPLRS
jgi:hypothetical protein